MRQTHCFPKLQIKKITLQFISGRYGALVHSLNSKGFDVFALDHHGHGRSEGIKGRVPGMVVYF